MDPTQNNSLTNWCVYIILCTDNTLYTGITNDLNRRYLQHANLDGAKYFRGRKPKKIMYVETGHTRSSASQREATIKKMQRRAKLQLIQSNRNEIANLEIEPTAVGK